MTDFPSLIRLLSQNNVEFIIIGGAAATAHGSARLTQDLDVVYRRTPDNVGRLASSLAPHSPYLRDAPSGLPFRFDVETITRGLNFTLVTDLGGLNLFGEITGEGLCEDLLLHAIMVEMFETSYRCLGLKRLIEVKRAAGRPRDLEAVAELEALLEMKERQS